MAVASSAMAVKASPIPAALADGDILRKVKPDLPKALKSFTLLREKRGTREKNAQK